MPSRDAVWEDAAVNPQRALISVSDKTGVVELGRALEQRGVEIVSSGGTAAALQAAGVAARRVAEITGAPEILGGRVKTLHPKIHGGILADRRDPAHLHELEDHGISPIDIVVCNLYPFERAAGDPSTSLDDALEQIDIGGPAMVRAAAKNFHSVIVVTNPHRYEQLLKALDTGVVSLELRRELARDAFAHTAAYDAAITNFLGEGEWPDGLMIRFHKAAALRYGENPHQRAAFYRDPGEPVGLAAAVQLHGKELSYNNLLDGDAAWKLVGELVDPAAAIIKHSNPCGAAEAESLPEAFAAAFDCDRTSAFGGIVALSRSCDEATAAQIAEIFTEVVIASDFEPGALEVLAKKRNIRLLRAPPAAPSGREMRTVTGGLLVQSVDEPDLLEEAKVVTMAQPSKEQWADLRFAWTVAKHVKSNAIVLANNRTAWGVGAGQMSRVESTQLAARGAGERARGCVCASDAFFPFRDGLDAAVAAGAVALIQPGGSVRDDEVVEAANEHGVPMVFTGRRHFRH